MTALRAFAELNEAGDRIEVHFRYSPEAVAAVREVPGRRFSQGPPKHWTVPLSLTSARRLREAFGQGLQLGAALIEWGREEVRRERNIRSLKTADDAALARVPADRADWLRPYQRADVAMMAAGNALNANQPGTGKTVETIYAVREAGLEGPHLVIAPVTLHKDPWLNELTEHAPDARVFWGTTPKARRAAIEQALDAAEQGDTNVWLLVNPEAIRVESDKAATGGTAFGPERLRLSRDHKGNGYYAKPEAERMFRQVWGAVVADEFHKYGLGENRNTLFHRALSGLRSRRRFALSGTPMGGKPIRLWGVLNYMEPQEFSSKWRWAEQWLTNADGSGPVEPGAGTGIGGIQPGREDEFYAAHSRYMIRRTRKEALPGLPDKVVINVSAPMTPKQRKVYDEFSRAAEVAVSGGRLSANGILAEFARLKQLSNALCSIEGGDVTPNLAESGKVPVLIERLDEFGCRKNDPEPGARAIVASESQRMVAALEPVLRAEGLSVRRLDGTVTGDRRNAVLDWYKEETDDARVLVMTTQTGGVGLNLGMTGSIHILDETWNPDDQEQLEDRGMRNRTTALMVLYYRTEDSIQEYIASVAGGKRITNKNVLDTVREASRARRARGAQQD